MVLLVPTGGVVYLFNNQINKIIKKTHIHWAFLFLYIFINSLKPTPYGEHTWYLIVSQICIIIALWYYFHNVQKRYFQYLISLSKYSYGIYIFHNWLALYLISRTAQHLFPLAEWAANHTVLFPLCFFVITMGISFVLSWALLKTKIGSFLIG